MHRYGISFVQLFTFIAMFLVSLVAFGADDVAVGGLALVAVGHRLRAKSGRPED